MLAICLALWLGAGDMPAEELRLFDMTKPAMGTQFRLTFYASTEELAQTAAASVFERISELEQVFSDYRPDSELTKLNRSGELFVSPPLFEVVKISLELSKFTQGAFDITAGHYSQLWRRSKRKGGLPTEVQLAKVRPLVDWGLVQLEESSQTIRLAKPGMQLDLGGIAKGYSADAALDILRKHGIHSAIVAASGDLAIGAPPPDQPQGWSVKLRAFEFDAANDRELTLRLSRCGVSTSGDLHQFVEIAGKRYSHIIDPKTGLGLTRRIAASVIAPDATTSDALATAACILGSAKALSIFAALPEVQARVTSLDGNRKVVKITPNWNDASSSR